MNTGIDKLLEDEYAAQQMEEQCIHSSEINSENENKAEMEISALLIDISETLRLLNEQMIRLNDVTKILPETVAALRTTTEAVQYISNELPVVVREQCLEEYKKILANAVKNYNQMQKGAENWKKSIEEEGVRRHNLIAISAILTPILLFVNLIFK